MPYDTDDATAAATRLQTFGVILAVGVVLHEIQFGASPWGAHGLVVVAAVVVLTRPRIPTLILLFGAFGLELLAALPDPFNHTVVLGVLGGGVALWWGVSRGEWRHRPEQFLPRVEPVIRTAVIGMWGFAFVAKLNRGFFDMGSSCAVWLVEQVPLVTLPANTDRAVVIGTLLMEGLVPVLLFWRPGRLLGIALAWSFHLVAALAGHTAFSGLALALYIPFLPAGLPSAAVAWATSHLRPGERAARAWRHPMTAIILGSAIILLLAMLQVAPDSEVAVRVRRFVPTLLYLPWAAAYAAALVAGWAAMRRVAAGPPEHVSNPRALWHVASVTMLLVLGLNALSPYVGLKTGWSLTMYSNLRTEPGHWNHLVVPESLRVFDWQDDLITFYDAEPEVANALGLGYPVHPSHVPIRRVRVAATSHPGALVRTGQPDAPWKPLSTLAPGTTSLFEQRTAKLRTVPLEPRCQL